MVVSMTAMLLFALQFSLLEARLRLVRVTLASCLSRFPLYCFPLCCERLLCLNAHCRPLKGFRRLTGAPFIAADMTWLGLTPPTRPCAYCFLGFETLKNSSFETEKELMMA